MNTLEKHEKTSFYSQRPAGRAAGIRRRVRSGFLTLGLILCLILILTTAAVLWSYQYLTIQNLELECAARSALHGAMADGSLLTYLQNSGAISSGTADAGALSTSTLQKILNENTAQQTRGEAVTVSVKSASDTAPVLAFSQPRVLGVFRNVFSSEKIQEVEGTSESRKTFTQYYEIAVNGGAITGYTKVYR